MASLVEVVLMYYILNTLAECEIIYESFLPRELYFMPKIKEKIIISSTPDMRRILPTLPNTYEDKFIPGTAGRPTLGSMRATCWARGGICVDLKECPTLEMDVGVPGCSRGYKVCCIVHNGALRRVYVPQIYTPEDLGISLQLIGVRNSMLKSYEDNNWVNEERNSQ